MSLQSSIYAFESYWVSQFWTPGSVHADDAFNRRAFLDYLAEHDMDMWAVPPRRKNKNAIDSKHRIIRPVYVRLKHSIQLDDQPMRDASRQSPLNLRHFSLADISISNDLYSSEV